VAVISIWIVLVACILVQVTNESLFSNIDFASRVVTTSKEVQEEFADIGDAGDVAELLLLSNSGSFQIIKRLTNYRSFERQSIHCKQRKTNFDQACQGVGEAATRQQECKVDRSFFETAANFGGCV
jgi:hypothetical protein